MKVLVIGKGGREHALVWKLAQSPRVERVYCARQRRHGRGRRQRPHRGRRLRPPRPLRQEGAIGLTVVGPEEPLARGIVDHFQKAGLRIFGPTKEAAQLEASKVFAKKLMRHADVPTAEFRSSTIPTRPALRPDARIPRRRQGRRPGGGQGRHRLLDEGRGAGRHRPHHGARGVRPRRRPADRHREAAGRRGAEHPGPGVGPHDHAAAADAGPQGGLRRRHGTQHRRHGRLLPGPAGARRPCSTRSTATCWCRRSTP